jgi:hypothetical protein
MCSVRQYISQSEVEWVVMPIHCHRTVQDMGAGLMTRVPKVTRETNLLGTLANVMLCHTSTLKRMSLQVKSSTELSIFRQCVQTAVTEVR